YGRVTNSSQRGLAGERSATRHARRAGTPRGTGPCCAAWLLPRGAAVDVVLVNLLPCEEGAQLLARHLDGVLGALLAQGEELGAAGILVLDEAVGECTRLDVREHRLHVLLHLGGDDARAGDVVAVLGRVG